MTVRYDHDSLKNLFEVSLCICKILYSIYLEWPLLQIWLVLWEECFFHCWWWGTWASFGLQYYLNMSKGVANPESHIVYFGNFFTSQSHFLHLIYL